DLEIAVALFGDDVVHAVFAEEQIALPAELLVERGLDVRRALFAERTARHRDFKLGDRADCVDRDDDDDQQDGDRIADEKFDASHCNSSSVDPKTKNVRTRTLRMRAPYVQTRTLR